MGRSPWPIVRAEAIAAFSTTRKNSKARSLSMFTPKLFTFASGRVSVAMNASAYKPGETIPLRGLRGEGDRNSFGQRKSRCLEWVPDTQSDNQPASSEVEHRNQCKGCPKCMCPLI